MNFVVTVNVASVATIGVPIDEDVNLVGASAVTTSAVLSLDPTLTWAIATAGIVVNEVLGNWRIFLVGGNLLQTRIGLQLFLQKDSTLYLGVNGTLGAIELYFSPSLSQLSFL